MKTNIHFWSYLAQFFSEWEMFQTKVVEKIKTHILCPTTFLKNHTFYEIMSKNIVWPGWAQMTIWRTCIACCISTTNTHSGYVIFIAFTLQQWLDECASMWCYTYNALVLDRGEWSESHPSCLTKWGRE